MRLDIRTIGAAGLTMALAHIVLDYPLPIDFSGVLPILRSLALFIGYLYLMRTLFRLPFAVVIVIRRTRYAQQHYQLSWRESLSDGFTRGVLDRRRWTKGTLALLDRLALLAFIVVSAHPRTGILWVTLLGMIGILMMVIAYLISGTFNFLLGDGHEAGWSFLD